MPPAPRPTWRFRVVAFVVTTILFRLLRWRADVDGLEHVPARGGFVLVWNHHSNVDYMTVAMPLYHRLGRPVRFLAKRVLWDSRGTRWMVVLADAVPVERDSDAGRARAYDAAVTALREGHVVGVAPEGTISDSFELLPFRLGAVRMAQVAGVPIVPCVAWGSQRAFPRGRRAQARFRQPVVVRYGPPLEVGADEPLEAANARLERGMTAMLRQVQDAYPVDPTPGDDWWAPARLGGSAPPHAQVLAEHRERAAAWRGPAGAGDAPNSMASDDGREGEAG